MSEDIYSFSEGVQMRIAAMMIRDSFFIAQNIDVIKPEYFENKILSDIIALTVKFYEQYKRAPVFDELIEETSTFLTKNAKLPADVYWEKLGKLGVMAETEDFSYVKDKAVDFARYQAMKREILDASGKIKKTRDYGQIVSAIKEASMIGEDLADLGEFYFETLEERIAKRRSGDTRAQKAIPTGIDKFDRLLGGGIAPPELGIIMGMTFAGKTILAVNFAFGAAMAGYNVCHYVLESSVDRTWVIYDSRISGISKDELVTRDAEMKGAICNEFEIKTGGRKTGRIIAKKYPAQGASALTIESHLQKLQMLEGFKPDLIIIDYLGLMRPADKRINITASSTGVYHMLGFISKELLALAHQQNLAIWLLHQANKASESKKYVGLGHSADSQQPIRDADIVVSLGIEASEAKRKLQKINLFVPGGREMRDKVSADLMMDKERCLVFDPEVEAM